MYILQARSSRRGLSPLPSRGRGSMLREKSHVMPGNSGAPDQMERMKQKRHEVVAVPASREGPGTRSSGAVRTRTVRAAPPADGTRSLHGIRQGGRRRWNGNGLRRRRRGLFGAEERGPGDPVPRLRRRRPTRHRDEHHRGSGRVAADVVDSHQDGPRDDAGCRHRTRKKVAVSAATASSDVRHHGTGSHTPSPRAVHRAALCVQRQGRPAFP